MFKSKFIGALIVAAAIAPVMGSCSKDDDAPDGPNSSEVSNIAGTRVTSVGNVQIRYDNKGRAYRFVDSYGYKLEIDYDKNKIYFDTDEFDEMDVKFNGKGFITEMSASWNYKEDDYEYKGSGKITLSYDKDCLSSMKVTSSETEKDLSDKSTSKYSMEDTQKFKWNKGNLVTINFESKEVEDGEKEFYTTDIDVKYGFDENKFRQFPMSLLYEMESEYDVFFAVGLMGNGPVDLPNKIIVSEVGESDRSYDIRFNLNNNGSISTEYFGYSSIPYGYSEISRAGLGASDKMYRLTPKSLFKHSSRTR